MRAVGQDLARDLRAQITIAGGELPADAIASLGGWDRIAAEAVATTADPAFVQLVTLVVRDADPTDAESAAGIRAVADAILGMASAAGFSDSLELLLSSPMALDVVAEPLATGLLAKITSFAAINEPTRADVSQAADALEALTRLKVGGYGNQFALLAELDRFRAPVPPRLASAIIRSIGTAVDHWPDAAQLTSIVKVQAGMARAEGRTASGADPEAVASDASWVLANIELAGALRATTPADMAAGLAQSRKYLDIGATAYDREDAAVLGAVLDIIIAVVGDGTEPSHKSLDVPALGPDHVADLVEAALRFNITASGMTHWYSDVKRQTLASWVLLVEDLSELHDQFAQDSFYRPESVIDRLLQIYLASRSTLVVRRDDDFGSVLGIVQPVVESGFASKAGFIANLDQYVRELRAKVDATSETDKRIALAADLDTAAQVLDAARQVVQRGDPAGKGNSGAAAEPLPQSLQHLFAGTPQAAKLVELGPDALAKLAAAIEYKQVGRNVSLTEDRVIDALQPDLDTCPDYNDETREAVDELVLLLIRFVADRLNVQSDARPYLFNPKAKEDDLHQDLYGYLSAVLGAIAEMEVQHIGGGRADIRIKYSTFSIYLELKVDNTKKDLSDKDAYIKQTVAYQASDIRLGFLVALRLAASPAGGPPPHLTSLFNYTCFDVPADTQTRHIILVEVPGNRTKPSAMKAK